MSKKWIDTCSAAKTQPLKLNLTPNCNLSVLTAFTQSAKWRRGLTTPRAERHLTQALDVTAGAKTQPSPMTNQTRWVAGGGGGGKCNRCNRGKTRPGNHDRPWHVYSTVEKVQCCCFFPQLQCLALLLRLYLRQWGKWQHRDDAVMVAAGVFFSGGFWSCKQRLRCQKVVGNCKKNSLGILLNFGY